MHLFIQQIVARMKFCSLIILSAALILSATEVSAGGGYCKTIIRENEWN